MTSLPTLIHARYGQATYTSIEEGPELANPILEGILQHKSVRHFVPDPVPASTLRVLLAAGQSAATSSNLQTWSAVAVQDPARKARAATLCADQDFIRQAPLFLVFCADLHRLTRVSQRAETPGKGLEYLEMFLMASLDAALAAQNMLTAAESIGLGGCYVGAARNHPQELAELLHLPDRVVALFGMAIGRPDPAVPASVKPRLPQDEVLHLETWREDSGSGGDHLASYDEALARFNADQKRDLPLWTERSAKRVATEGSLSGRHVLRQVLQRRGFNLQ